jgi:hypothetical protein
VPRRGGGGGRHRYPGVGERLLRLGAWAPWVLWVLWERRGALHSSPRRLLPRNRGGLTYRLRRVRVRRVRRVRRSRRGRRGRRGRAAVDNFSDYEVKQARGLGGRRRGE